MALVYRCGGALQLPFAVAINIMRATCDASQHPPRVAVCISGTARTFATPLVLEKLHRNFVRQLGDEPARLFLHIKSADSGKSEGSLSFSATSANAAQLAKRLKSNDWLASGVVSEAVIVHGASSARSDIHGVPHFAVMGTRTTLERWQAWKATRCKAKQFTGGSSPPCCVLYGDYIERADNEERLLQNFIGWRWCRAAIHRHEARTGARFDLVAFTRPDLVWWRPITPWCDYGHRSHMVSCNAAGCDMAWVVPRELSDRLLGLADLHRDCTSRPPARRPRHKHLVNDCCSTSEYLFWYARMRADGTSLPINETASKALHGGPRGAASVLRSAVIDVTPASMCAVIIGALNATATLGRKAFRLTNRTSKVEQIVHNAIYSVCELVLSPAYDVGRHAWDLQTYCGLPIRTAQELRAIFPTSAVGRDLCSRELGGG